MPFPEIETLYHMDKEISTIILQLLDRLCEWERDTGRRSTLILIPEAKDEDIILAMEGKPIPINTQLYLETIFKDSLKRRNTE